MNCFLGTMGPYDHIALWPIFETLKIWTVIIKFEGKDRCLKVNTSTILCKILSLSWLIAYLYDLNFFIRLDCIFLFSPIHEWYLI